VAGEVGDEAFGNGDVASGESALDGPTAEGLIGGGEVEVVAPSMI